MSASERPLAMEKVAHAKTKLALDEARAEVERLRAHAANSGAADLEARLSLADGRRLRAEADNERLREALRRIMGLDGRDETFCLDQKCGTCDECFARAALASTPEPGPTAREMRVAADPCDADLVLSDAKTELTALRAQLEAVARERDEARADAARLREALTQVRDAMRATGQEPDGDDDPRRPVASAVWHALDSVALLTARHDS